MNVTAPVDELTVYSSCLSSCLFKNSINIAAPAALKPSVAADSVIAAPELFDSSDAETTYSDACDCDIKPLIVFSADVDID